MFYRRKALAVFLLMYCLIVLYIGIHFQFWTSLSWLAASAAYPLCILLHVKKIRFVSPFGKFIFAFALQFVWAVIIYDIIPIRDEWEDTYWIISVTATLIILYIGRLHAKRLHVRRLHLKLKIPRHIRIVAAADIHAGGVINRRELERLSEKINEYKPDILLLVGDITDGDVDNARDSGIVECLAAMKAQYGKYAVLGNHDIYAGRTESIDMLNEGGFTVLEDEAAVAADSFVLIGRNDPRGEHFGIARSPINKIKLPDIDLPVIVADHTPININEAADFGAALQFSGHTHGGQIFPFNFVTKKMYDVTYGLYRRKNTVFYVTSGAGLWGTPLRTWASTEIVVCDIDGEDMLS